MLASAKVDVRVGETGAGEDAGIGVSVEVRRLAVREKAILSNAKTTVAMAILTGRMFEKMVGFCKMWKL